MKEGGILRPGPSAVKDRPHDLNPSFTEFRTPAPGIFPGVRRAIDHAANSGLKEGQGTGRGFSPMPAWLKRDIGCGTCGTIPCDPKRFHLRMGCPESGVPPLAHRNPIAHDDASNEGVGMHLPRPTAPERNRMLQPEHVFIAHPVRIEDVG